MTIRIGIIGAGGRMGRAIANAAAEAGASIAGGIDREGAVHGDYASPAALAAASDVLIDFSTPDALPASLDAARAAGKPIVIGTTGLQPGHHALIDAAAADIPVLQSANTSLGVNLLRALVKEAARRLGSDWDIEVLEMHHRNKVDAPSGTALMLAAAAAEGRGATLQELSRFDRISLHPHAREPGTIGYASLRGGSVAGDHNIIFAAEGERIELGHRAENRGIFARGAVKAALWLADRPAGRYQMVDVLGL
ncbi:4-hydroxy-tetrahydrodipicolinate reductase [Sphingomonas quercus]|uniref:4-hydroxy-tetrahydrodipicolinate reductase n=1 Tax=Sphingomonas quercus TaxID=2842451 RepID=A0ABS6BHP2_9SPHN|nr:4-hydroxy-tetrahydrodipicolinate reductase [Sphingomonas quercus]MBU3076750.1 4-hydroxy-tetrahydrodipicolinate reductase [Sphingomonas quercus]